MKLVRDGVPARSDQLSRANNPDQDERIDLVSGAGLMDDNRATTRTTSGGLVLKWAWIWQTLVSDHRLNERNDDHRATCRTTSSGPNLEKALIRQRQMRGKSLY